MLQGSRNGHSMVLPVSMRSLGVADHPSSLRKNKTLRGNRSKQSPVVGNRLWNICAKTQPSVSASLCENVWQKRHVVEGNVSENLARADAIQQSVPNVSVSLKHDRHRKTREKVMYMILMHQEVL